MNSRSREAGRGGWLKRLLNSRTLQILLGKRDDARLHAVLRPELVLAGSMDPEQTIRQLDELLRAGADIDGRDAWGRTPLERAIQCRLDPRFSEALIERGATIRHSQGSLLLSAFEANDQRLVLLLLKHGANPNVRNPDHSTALHLAAARNWSEPCRELLDRGADINARCKRGFTPVHLATCFHYPDVVQLLRMRGAKVDFRPADVDPFPMAMAARWRALLDGFPAFITGVTILPGASRGAEAAGIDATTGLPVFTKPFVESFVDGLEIRGRRAATNRYLRTQGLPWNSRLPWINIWKNPTDYFAKAALSGGIVTLNMNGPTAAPPRRNGRISGECAKALESGPGQRHPTKSTSMMGLPCACSFRPQTDMSGPTADSVRARGGDRSS